MIDHYLLFPFPFFCFFTQQTNKHKSGTNTLYAEPKQTFHQVYQKISNSSQDSQSLFLLSSRTTTVMIRPMDDTDTRRNNYKRSNIALQTSRTKIPLLLNRTAPLSVRIYSKRMDRLVYMKELMKHRFVISPAGNGLDCHGTWEALLAGCIPIVPHSSLDPMFDHLPVWFVSSWEEVTDEMVARKAKELVDKFDTYRFEKIFAEWWRTEINQVGW
jgi:hypothetical protein